MTPARTRSFARQRVTIDTATPPALYLDAKEAVSPDVPPHEAWEKVLWRKQPYADNYVPPSFLSELNEIRACSRAPTPISSSPYTPASTLMGEQGLNVFEHRCDAARSTTHKP